MVGFTDQSILSHCINIVCIMYGWCLGWGKGGTLCSWGLIGSSPLMRVCLLVLHTHRNPTLDDVSDGYVNK